MHNNSSSPDIKPPIISLVCGAPFSVIHDKLSLTAPVSTGKLGAQVVRVSKDLLTAPDRVRSHPTVSLALPIATLLALTPLTSPTRESVVLASISKMPVQNSNLHI